MKSLKQKLKEDLKYYLTKSKSFKEEHIIEIPGFDFDFNWLAMKRERLEKNKFFLSPEDQRIMEEADLRFLKLWEQVKDKDPIIPHNKIAKAFLKDIVEIIKKSQEPRKTKTRASAKRRVNL
jgi:hypothetical protein